MNNKEWVRPALAIAQLGILLFLLVMLFQYSIPSASHDVILIVIGGVMTNSNGVFGYYFGSSKSSADKDKLLAGQPTDASTDPNTSAL